MFNQIQDNIEARNNGPLLFTGNGQGITQLLGGKPYTSKSKRNECKNEVCTNQKRHGSAYCQPCSDKYSHRRESMDSSQPTQN